MAVLEARELGMCASARWRHPPCARAVLARRAYELPGPQLLVREIPRQGGAECVAEPIRRRWNPDLRRRGRGRRAAVADQSLHPRARLCENTAGRDRVREPLRDLGKAPM